jgi:hypothetical protein
LFTDSPDLTNDEANAPFARKHLRVCHTTRAWLISFSLGVKLDTFMDKVVLIPRTRRQLVLQAFAMSVVVEVIGWILFRYRYGVRGPLWYWPSIAVLNFVLFVGFLSLMRWLRQKREEWSSTTQSWYGAVMLAIGVALIAAALYLCVRR